MRPDIYKVIIIHITLFLCPFLVIEAQIKLPKLIDDGMVLQRDTTVNIWGWASPFENIYLKIQDLELY